MILRQRKVKKLAQDHTAGLCGLSPSLWVLWGQILQAKSEETGFVTLKTRMAQAVLRTRVKWHRVRARLSSHFWVNCILVSVQWGLRGKQWPRYLGGFCLGSTENQHSQHECWPSCEGINGTDMGKDTGSEGTDEESIGVSDIVGEISVEMSRSNQVRLG